MPRTPIAGVEYSWVSANGVRDLAVAECGDGLAGAVDVLAACALAVDGGALDARDLPPGDVDVLIAEVRVSQFGDHLVVEGTCSECGAAIDIDLGVSAYVGHRRPRKSARVERDGDDAFHLLDTETWFRIPSCGDVLDAMDSPRPRRALVDRSIWGRPTPATRRAVERALAQLSPTLCGVVEGVCPECRELVQLDVNVRDICLQELRFVTASVHDDVHTLASAYHWSEHDILALPSSRRRAYVTLVRGTNREPDWSEAFDG